MTFKQLSETIHTWMGWCPNASYMQTVSTHSTHVQVTVHPLEPDGGAGGAERWYRGMRLAIGSTKILARNKRLLWFSFFTGLALLFMFIAERSLLVYGSYPYPEIEYPLWLALVFGIQFVTVFCLYFFLAGIITSISSMLSGKPVILHGEISSARSYLRSIAGWSVVMALFGTAIYAILLQYYYAPLIALSELIYQFPFYFILSPEILGTGPIGGDSHVLSAVTFTLFAMIAYFAFFLLTLFVVPVIVFEKKNLSRAVAESFLLAKTCRAEILSCFLVFCLVLLAVSLASLIFRVAYHVVSFDDVFFWYQGGWIASAALYILVWSIVALIVSTVLGISLAGLYTYAKTGRIPELFTEN
jgi:hypothetical protein